MSAKKLQTERLASQKSFAKEDAKMARKVEEARQKDAKKAEALQRKEAEKVRGARRPARER